MFFATADRAVHPFFLNCVFERYSLSISYSPRLLLFIIFLYDCFWSWVWIESSLVSADVFSDLCTAALSDSEDNDGSTWGNVSQDSR